MFRLKKYPKQFYFVSKVNMKKNTHNFMMKLQDESFSSDACCCVHVFFVYSVGIYKRARFFKRVFNEVEVTGYRTSINYKLELSSCLSLKL
jgi:hypothetical protein